MEIFNFDQRILDLVIKMTQENKALVSAIHNTGNCYGEAKSSLGEFINEAVLRQLYEIKECGLITLAVYPEIKDGLGRILNLYHDNLEAPAKFRDVKISLRTIQHINEVTKRLEGDWVLYKNGKKARDFHFEDDLIQMNKWLTGIVLYQQVRSKFKSISQDVSFDLKARGQLLAQGDYLILDMYYLNMTRRDYGLVTKQEMIINFTNGTYATGLREPLIVEKEKEKTIDDIDLDEDLEREDIDPLEL